MRTAAIAVASFGLLLTTAACTDGASGTPTTAPAGDTSSPAATTPTTSRLLPPRPRDIDLTGVDPCKVLTQAQSRELAYDLGYQRPPQPAGKSVINGGPICGYGSSSPTDQPSRHISTNITISTSEDASAWLTDPARAETAKDARKTTIEGFPALVLPNPEQVAHDDCDAVVDTHDGQYIQIVTGPDPGHGGKGPEPSCQEAVRVAGMAIQTIESQR